MVLYLPISLYLRNGSTKKRREATMKIKNRMNLLPNELCVLIKVRSELPEEKQIEFDILPILHEDMSELSDSALDTVTDIMKAMCAVAVLEPPALDVLLEIYYDKFQDMERMRVQEETEGVVIPFPFPPVTKH
jgi:hypothetical protein